MLLLGVLFVVVEIILNSFFGEFLFSDIKEREKKSFVKNCRVFIYSFLSHPNL
jgi:hypothetical protein